MRGVDGRMETETGRTRAGARRGIGGGVPASPGIGDEERPESNFVGVEGMLLRRSAVVVGVGVEGLESGSGIAEGVPGRTPSAGGCREALGGRTGAFSASATDSSFSSSDGLIGGVLCTGEDSTGCG